MGWLKRKLKKAGLTKAKFGGPLKALAVGAAVVATGGLALGPLAATAGTLTAGAGGLSGIVAAGTAAVKAGALKKGQDLLNRAAKADGHSGAPEVQPLHRVGQPETSAETASVAKRELGPGQFLHLRFK